MNPTHSDVILDRLMSLHPKIIDLTLDRMTRLLDALGSPEKSLPPVIHVAGTNGKGSTSAMIRAGLEAAGKTVHMYTSPHLARFHERIYVAGELITEEALSDVLEECEKANGDIPITYFEITTCAALLVFARTPAGYCILEVGLGGRLDATNVVDNPVATVITPVSVDHQQYLGETLAEIAGEKAGILKPNSFGIVARQHDTSLDVIETKAKAVWSTMKVFGQHWHISQEDGRMIYQDEYGLLDLPMPNLLGDHQIDNAGTAIATLRALSIDVEAIEQGVTSAKCPARLQRLRSGPLVTAAPEAEIWLDGGHNAAAGLALASALAQFPARPTYLICGMLNTKDVTGYMRPLADGTVKLFAVSIPGEAATLSASETAAAAKEVDMSSAEAESVEAALMAVVAENPDARVLICGSLYLAGNVLRQNA